MGSGFPKPHERLVSENDVFFFCLVSQSSRKTAHCCLENLCVEAFDLMMKWMVSNEMGKQG
jgi:hypothetical protein